MGKDRGRIITEFDGKFGATVEHEVIKMILQNCNWNEAEATQTILDFSSAVKCDVTISSRPYDEPVVVLLRGLPGSGKSSLAQLLTAKGGVVHSTDDYFVDNRGNYVFNAGMLSDAHDWNKRKARASMQRGIPLIVVDNTNTQVWEMQPYASDASRYNYAVDILEPNTSWKDNANELARRTRHGVPKSKIIEMLDRYERNVTVDTLRIPNCRAARKKQQRPTMPLEIQGHPDPAPNPSLSGSHGSNSSGMEATALPHLKRKQRHKKKKKKQDTPPQCENKAALWNETLLVSRIKPPDAHTKVVEKAIPVATSDASTEASSTTHQDDRTLTGCPDRYVCSSTSVSYKANQLHAGSMTDEIHYEMTHAAALQKLALLFPGCSMEAISELFVHCDWNIDWTTELLMDGGYVLNDQSSDETPPEIRPRHSVTSSTTGSLCDDLHGLFKSDGTDSPTDGFWSSDPSRRGSVTSSENDCKPNDQSEKSFMLQLDTQFALDLVQTFGPVGGLDPNSVPTATDCQITLPYALCQQLHNYWCQNASGESSQQPLDTLWQDQQLAATLQKQENNLPHPGVTSQEHDIQDAPYMMQEIIELETALQNSKQKKADKSSHYSSILNMKKLTHEFASVDPLAIERFFHESDFNYKKTKRVLLSKFGPERPASSANTCVVSQSIPDTPTSSEASLDHKALREQAEHHYAEMTKFHVKSQLAKKITPVAQYYAREAAGHAVKMKRANHEAAQVIVKNNNTNRNTLDLHHLHVSEAVAATKRFLAGHVRALALHHVQSLELQIVTGRGSNSHGHKAKLKPSIASYLKQCGYSFYEEYADSGVLFVVLKS